MQNNIDLVCGMDFEGFSDLAQTAYKDSNFYFRGDHCKETFQKDPEKFQKQPLIRLNKIQKIFKVGGIETRVLQGLDFYVWEGDFISIIGAIASNFGIKGISSFANLDFLGLSAVLAITFTTGVISGILPTRQASKMELAEALRYE